MKIWKCTSNTGLTENRNFPGFYTIFLQFRQIASEFYDLFKFWKYIF